MYARREVMESDTLTSYIHKGSDRLMEKWGVVDNAIASMDAKIDELHNPFIVIKAQAAEIQKEMIELREARQEAAMARAELELAVRVYKLMKE
jgi:hypothetical protein